MIFGGLVGGFFVTLAAGACHRRAISPLYIGAASGLGAVAALPFVSWLPAYRHSAPALGDVARLTLAFAVWQSVVGTYLFVVTRNQPKSRRNRSTNDVESPGRPLVDTRGTARSLLGS